MRFCRKFIPFILVLIFLVSVVSADSYIIQDERRYIIRNAYEIINDGVKDVYNLNIKVLVGSHTDSPYQKNLTFSIYPFPDSLSKDEWGNTYAYINIKELKPGQKIDVIVDREILNGGIFYDKSIYHVKADYKYFLSNPSNSKYILPGEKIESDNPQIKAKALELAKTGTIVEKAKKIYDFVNLHIKYDTDPNYANKGALSGFITGRGVCDEYASLFTALCRAAGIPARVVEGYWLEGEVKESKWTDVSDRRHAWSEFYLPGAGWIPVEPSFLYTYNGKRVPNEKYFANIGAGDKHLIISYMSNPIKNDIDVQYSYYESDGVDMKLISGEERIMLLPKDTNASKKYLTDIEGNWAQDYIQKLFEADVVLPKEGSMYKPGEYITRAEFAAYLTKAIGLREIDGRGSYKDVSSKNPYAGYIEAASRAGLIQGYNGYFYPENNITRQDAAVIMMRALRFFGKNIDTGSGYSFTDSSSISHYAVDAVKLMYELNIMSGKPGNIFAPNDFTTRAEAAKIILAFMGLI
ncbi:S-layer homology domain-containing protein [Lutispora thermophila]|uniref:Transglutaminase-like enzyme, putative cysteine protease n=1 Tax=Lutispora thermophila DSM 19022 TaxID=1122184 RepID=A0A1M6B7U6_9FIRM|nr:S-layer homology domain-containing protein [Lutispora thermophila]SHI44796.1 Transglutaminase-like enzyme, putative cysteine protease [Lutispora thermophila DSM 19022]